MNIKFICHEEFKFAEEICIKIKGYLPNLIHKAEITRTDDFIGIFQTWDILPKIERIAKPNWDNDIVMVVIQGSLYFADLEHNEAASTLDYLVLKGKTIRPFSERPMIGVQFLPANMSEELREDIEYWAKTGVEEILHYFGIPEKHDENCFFHSKEYGKTTMDDGRKDYCQRCRYFMLQLKAPLYFDKLLARVEDIYELRSK